MKKQDLSKIIMVCTIAWLGVSCGNSNQFKVEGEVANAQGKMMYFENVGITKVTVLDSIKLSEKGTFRFKQSRPECPDFYRFRLDNQLINIAIDSIETIKIHADATQFAKNYTVEGSVECDKIKTMTLLQLKTNEAYNKLQKTYNAKEISADEYVEKQKEVINGYKEAARKDIFVNPKSTSSYFALFQQINKLLIFDPYDKEDYKAFGAVATSWNHYYPKAKRSKHLYSIAMQALKVIRGERPIEYAVTESVDHFEIALPAIDGKTISLSEFCKGKVTLVDFTAYQMKESPAHNMHLAGVYEKYKNHGFEIYQVSLDADEHSWKNAAVNLPWICVRDPKSTYSTVAATYNVKEIPTGFILNKSGEIVKRLESFLTLETEIAPYLK